MQRIQVQSREIRSHRRAKPQRACPRVLRRHSSLDPKWLRTVRMILESEDAGSSAVIGTIENQIWILQKKYGDTPKGPAGELLKAYQDFLSSPRTEQDLDKVIHLLKQKRVSSAKRYVSVRLWLDDVRTPPKGFVWVKTPDEAIRYLESNNVEYVSLDHDLGDDVDGTGYDVAKWIEEKAFHGELSPLEWNVHSANPVGVRRMQQALRNADRFWG